MTEVDRRRELQQIALTYLDALLSADGSSVPLAPNAVRTHYHAGPQLSVDGPWVHGRSEIRESIKQEKLRFRRDLEFTIDTETEEVLAKWTTGTPYEGAEEVLVLNRFSIEGTYIKRILAVSVPTKPTADTGSR